MKFGAWDHRISKKLLKDDLICYYAMQTTISLFVFDSFGSIHNAGV